MNNKKNKMMFSIMLAITLLVSIVVISITSVVSAKAADSNSIIIHYYSDDGDPYIYYWNSLPDNIEVEWPGKKMSYEKENWYTYSFSNKQKINLIFNKGGAEGTNQTEDLTRDAGEWWYKNGEWTPYDPDGSNPPPPTDGDFRDESIYFLMTTRFYDGDTSNNARCRDDDKAQNPSSDPSWRGDFKGVIDKLDYIKAMGFSAIWITPVVKNDSGYDYHGYHAYNFKEIDPRYLSQNVGFKELIDACHDKGIKVIQDIVLNHTCNYGEENLKQIDKGMDYDSRVNSIGNSAGDPEDIYHHFGYTSTWESFQVQTGHLAGDCIDLNTENPKVYNYVIDAYKKYINMGVDAFRIDTVKHISRLTFNKTFLPAFREAGGDNFFMFGENCAKYRQVWNSNMPAISVPFYSWKESKEYPWGDDKDTNFESTKQEFEDNKCMSDDLPTSTNAFLNGNDYHKTDYSMASGLNLIDFPMHWNFGSVREAFQVAKDGDKFYNDATWNVTYVDSHDFAPDGDCDHRFTGSQMTWAEDLDLMFTFRGIPCIYYGSEIEFMKGAPIDKGSTAPLSTTGRAYYGDNIEGSVSVTDYGKYSGATGTMKETLEYPLAKHIQRLNQIRRAIPALRKGQYSIDGVDGQIAFKRRYTDNNVDSFVCVTISGGATFNNVPSGKYVDAVTGQSIDCNGTLKVDNVQQGDMRVYVLQNSSSQNGKIGETGKYLS